MSRILQKIEKKTSLVNYPHYENMPIQLYWKFYRQKMKNFR